MFLSDVNVATCPATTTGDSRYALDHVKIDGSAFWATNGHSLYESFVAEPPETPVCIPAKVLLHEGKGKKGVYVLVSETSYTVSPDSDAKTKTTGPLPEIEYPNVQKILQSFGQIEYASSVIISVSELETLVKIVKRTRVQFLRLLIGSEMQPLRVISEGFTAYIMPCK